MVVHHHVAFIFSLKADQQVVGLKTGDVNAVFNLGIFNAGIGVPCRRTGNSKPGTR